MEATVEGVHGKGTEFFEVRGEEANIVQEQEEQELERGGGTATDLGSPKGTHVFTQF